MAQIFHPATNVLARLSLLIFGIIGPTATLLIAVGVSRLPFNTKVGVPLPQPVPFSHEHHSVELGIDCRYCHGGVEKSSYSPLPATEVCMSCHSQIWTDSPLLDPVRKSYAEGKPLLWNNVNAVPDFAYFPHNIHINRGISCNYCHGPIQKMMMVYKGKTFFMVWCLNCHRQPEKFIQPRENVFKLYQDIQRFGYAVDSSGKDENDPKREGLTPRQYALAEGQSYMNNDVETKTAQQLIPKYRVKKQQLADCWICHR